MSKLILSMDAGKYLTKSIGTTGDSSPLEAKKVSLRSKYYNLESGDIELAGDSYKIIYEGKELIIGEQGTINAVEETNKATLVHKLCVYTSIASYIFPNTPTDVYMVLACPLNLLRSPEYKEEYKNYIKNNGKEVNLTVDGEDYIFTIKDITIKSEGSGVLYLNKDKFLSKDYGIIDIGGLNMQFCLYVNGVPRPESRFTEMTGSNKLIQDIKDNLELMRKGKAVTFEQAERALKDKLFNNIPESKEVIINTINKYILEDVIKPITSRRISLDTIIPLIVGGTCLDIKEQLKTAISNVEIQDNAQWASVDGLYKIAYAKYRDWSETID